MNLPEGWTSEELAGNVVLTMPGCGDVTVSLNARGFALGWSTYVRHMPGYTGRGWKDRLYADAIKALRDVFADEQAASA